MTNPIPQRIAPDHFVGQARASTGEIIYLHMQLITAENQPYWQQYIKASIDMGYSARCAGLFPQIIRHTRKMKHQNSTQYTCGSFFSYNKSFFKSATGYTWQEFDAFVNALGQKGFIDTYKTDVLKLNTVGSHHIEPYHDGHRYIIYATKTEHFDIQATKLSKNLFQILPFKSYVEQYQNLLMCVTGDFNHMQYYENRGIFRNPYSVIENKHKNISMLLHAFSAAVAKHFFSQRILRIRPVSFMQQIICKTLESEDLTITGSSLEEALRASYEDTCLKTEYPENFISVDILSYYYRTNGQTDYYRFVRQEIKRLRENTDCFLSINSASKAEQIEAALRYIAPPVNART